MICFNLNGIDIKTNCSPDTTVLEFLREKKHNKKLTGTKEGCAEGDCGACSILLWREKKWQAVNSCILLLGQIEGEAIFTVEGLASLHGGQGVALQKQMAKNGSSQCGFCTPGIVISLAALLANENAKESQVHDALAGNLCRCTGYRPIVEAALKTKKIKLPKANITNKHAKVLGTNACKYMQPKTIAELLAYKSKEKQAMLLAGGTDISLPIAQAQMQPEKIISTRHVLALRKIEKTKTQLKIGGAVTIAELLPVLSKLWKSLETFLKRYGSMQIRTMATLAGNLATASPIGDMATCLLALDARLVLQNKKGTREINLNDFFVAYRKTILQSDEIIRTIIIPLPKKNEVFQCYKISKRYDQDISTICAAFYFQIKNNIIANARLAFGGMAAKPQRCLPAEKILTGKEFNEATLDLAKKPIAKFFTPLDDLRSTANYRLAVAQNLLTRFLQSHNSKNSHEVMDL